MWALWFGSPGEQQLNILPQHVIGIPPVFEYHLFWPIDFKEQAYIQTQPAGKSVKCISTQGTEFFMDFGFMCALADDYCHPNRNTDRIVTSYDGHCTYLIIVDSASCQTWAFLTESKEAPIAICTAFLQNFKNLNGIIRCDQGGELGRSTLFITTMVKDCGYVVGPTGSNSVSQNGGAERYNDTLAIKVPTLLYGSGLPAKF